MVALKEALEKTKDMSEDEARAWLESLSEDDRRELVVEMECLIDEFVATAECLRNQIQLMWASVAEATKAIHRSVEAFQQIERRHEDTDPD